MTVSGDQNIGKFPVHFKLAIGVFVVVLVRAPAQIKHIVANLADHIIAPHHRLLIIAGLFGCIIGIADFITLGGHEEKLCLDPGFDVQPLAGRFVNQTAQHITRGLRHIFAFHHAIGRHPGDLGFPWQLDHG